MPGQSWIPVAVGLGVLYALVGIVFALPTAHAHAWRLAAWGVSAIGYGAHIAYERFRFRARPSRAALHVACGVALAVSLVLARAIRPMRQP